MSFSELLKTIEMTPKQFAESTGWHYKTVVSWCKNEPPSFLIKGIEERVNYWIEANNGFYNSRTQKLHRNRISKSDFFKDLKNKIGHVAPRSGNYVGPDKDMKFLVNK